MKLSCFLFLFSILISTCAVRSQDYFEVYYPRIYEAEKHILNSRYSDALIAYESCFQKVPFVFGKDYYNAAMCAVIEKSYAKVFYYFERLAAQGMHIDWLAKQKFVQPVKNSEAWSKFEKKFPVLRNEFLHNYDQDVKRQLFWLDSLDQSFRKKENAYTLFMDTIHQIDQHNAKKLQELIVRYGYPGENVIGIQDSISTYCPGYFVLIHQTFFALPYQSPIDFSALVNQARLGNISPHTVANLLDAKGQVFFIDQLGVGLYKAIVSDSIIMNKESWSELEAEQSEADFFYYHREEESLRVFDIKRKELGLESSLEFREKVYKGTQDQAFFFRYIGGISIGNFTSIVDRNSFVKNLQRFK